MLEVGTTYVMRSGGTVTIDTKSQTEPPMFYGRQPDGRVTAWLHDGRTPPDRSGRTEYHSDFIGWVAPLGVRACPQPVPPGRYCNQCGEVHHDAHGVEGVSPGRQITSLSVKLQKALQTEGVNLDPAALFRIAAALGVPGLDQNQQENPHG